MNLYIAEIIVFIILAIILGIIIKFKKIEKIKLSISILISVFILAFLGTFIFEKPKMQLTNQQINMGVGEVQQINIEVGKVKDISKPQTTYHFRDITNQVQIKGKVDFNKIGEYEIKYSVPLIIGEYSEKQIINIIDTTSPKIMLNGEKELKLSYKAEYKEPGYSVEDNSMEELKDKVKTEKQEISETEYNIIYTVEDSSGNKATEIRKVSILDDIAPEIKLNGESNISITIGTKYEEKGAKALDEKDGDLTNNIQITGSVDTSKAGTYTITYKVKDSKGNEATATRKVTVNNKQTAQTITKPTQTVQPQNGTNGAKGVIYLTFDDGPSTTITPNILNILKQKNIKATFFILNYSSGTLENLVKREYNDGHTVAIHGYSHDYNAIYKSVDAYMNNITKLQEKIKKTTGYNTTITRFPGGSSNTVSRFNPGIMTKLTKEVIARGYKYFDWNVSSGDAGGARTSQDVYNNVTKNLRKDRSNVVLMHDFSGNTKTLNALLDIIDFGINNGYTFKAITQSTPMVTHGVNN